MEEECVECNVPGISGEQVDCSSEGWAKDIVCATCAQEIKYEAYWKED